MNSSGSENGQINMQNASPPGAGGINTTVGFLCVDNFHEAAGSLDEDKLPIFSALIDRKLSSFFQALDGVMCKYEKDRYMFVLSASALEAEVEKKFEILEHIKEINIGNAVPATLSMGIGLCGESLTRAAEYAKTALDLAMARGGDQTLIKDDQGYRFFGGKTSSPEHGGGVRARVKAAALSQLICDSANVYVIGHTRADLDSLGAALGVCVMAGHFGKRRNIVLSSPNQGIRKLYDKILEIPENRGLFIDCKTALKSFRKNSLLVVVDAHRPSFCECPELLGIAAKIVVIDHHRKHPENIGNAVLTYHEPYASSASELVTEMLRCIDSVALKPLEADALLAGITMDTKNFSLKTGARTFEAAGYLKRRRADTIRVRKLLQNDMESYMARSEIVRDAQIYMGNIAISVCPHNIENAQLVAAMAADELLNIVGIQVSFVLTITDLHVNISARSLGDINVQRIMEKLGGGGHQTVAGAQLPLESDMDMETAIQMVKDATHEYLEEEIK